MGGVAHEMPQIALSIPRHLVLTHTTKFLPGTALAGPFFALNLAETALSGRESGNRVVQFSGVESVPVHGDTTETGKHHDRRAGVA